VASRKRLMPLVDLYPSVREATVPRDVRLFLREAWRRVRRFLRDRHLPSFVPCDFHRAYLTLRAIAAEGLGAGNLFCEWGSGFGVVACLATLLEYDACGIEVEAELVDAARDLADHFGLPVEFAHGSFIPSGYDADAGGTVAFTALDTTTDGAYGALGLDPDDFDLIFAYPWPDEERLTADLFDCRGQLGALLITYHGREDLRVRRKVSRSPGQRLK
jgi:hypothetical protein